MRRTPRGTPPRGWGWRADGHGHGLRPRWWGSALPRRSLSRRRRSVGAGHDVGTGLRRLISGGPVHRAAAGRAVGSAAAVGGAHPAWSPRHYACHTVGAPAYLRRPGVQSLAACRDVSPACGPCAALWWASGREKAPRRGIDAGPLCSGLRAAGQSIETPSASAQVRTASASPVACR